jgi:ABC-type sugar transport system ATPase subunit
MTPCGSHGDREGTSVERLVDDRADSSLHARLRVDRLSKTFPGVTALSDVSLDIRPAEVHGLVGPNGSGKSTFIKVLSGFVTADPGARAWLDGKPVTVGHLPQGGGSGVASLAFVHQDLGLVLELSALDNFALRTGFAKSRSGRLDAREQARRASRLLEPLGAEVDLDQPLAHATPVERTMVAIAIALNKWDPGTGVLVLDEPTATLPYHEVQRLSEVVKRLRSRGAGILYVSHRLDEIFDLADRITVFRNGRRVETKPAAEVTKRTLIQQMLGYDLTEAERPAARVLASEPPALEVAGLSGRTVRDVSFSVAQGEVLGIAGLVGSGSDELPRLLSDQGYQASSGRVRYTGTEWWPVGRSPGNQVALVPPDRGREGIIRTMTVLENLTISCLGSLGSGLWLNKRRERASAGGWIQDLGIVTRGLDDRIENLSGGNQQKVILGRTLARSPQVLVLCEPTAGVDVGARNSIHKLIKAHVNDGLGVIVSSAATEDLIAMCDRVLVFRNGEIAVELSATELTEKRLVQAMEGAEEEDKDGHDSAPN